jgi:hypothetical protein
LKTISIMAAATVALFLAAGSAPAQQLDAAKCTQAKSENKIEDIKLFCPESDWPGDPQAAPAMATPASNAATLDETKCTQAKNDNKPDDVKLYCPESEWLPAQ